MDKLKIQENISLKEYTSMYVGGLARYFVVVKNLEELKYALDFAKQKMTPVFVLGGGSNILVSDSGFTGLVIKIGISGIAKILEDDESVSYKVGAGENWDKFVESCVDSDLFGLENLSHIPGTVGASVVQNIGAYGAEVSNTVVSIDVFDSKDLKFSNIKKEKLNFSYRKSVLNDPKQDKGRYIVVNVYFRLLKNGKVNTEYDDLKKYFSESKSEINLKNTRKAVIEVRNKKFPYPDKPENGTVGSFWNAEPVSEKVFNKIILRLNELGFKAKAKEMEDKKSVFKVKQGYKIPYGVLVEVLGYRGKKYNGVRILETHAGVINNFTGKGTAKEVVDLSNEVVENVYMEFGVRFRIEPELVGDFG
ncbi:MAG: UDP-N-acetylmuramate dehydrogenase [Minisyncoccia bacterium]